MTLTQTIIIIVGSLVVMAAFGVWLDSYLKKRNEKEVKESNDTLTVTYTEDENTSITKEQPHPQPVLPIPETEEDEVPAPKPRKRDAKGRFVKED